MPVTFIPHDPNLVCGGPSKALWRMLAVPRMSSMWPGLLVPEVPCWEALQMPLHVGLRLSSGVCGDRSEVWCWAARVGVLLDLGDQNGPSHLQGLSHQLLASQECAFTGLVLLNLITPSCWAVHNFPATPTALSLQADPAYTLVAHHLLTSLSFSSPYPPLRTSVPFPLAALSCLVCECWKKMSWSCTCFLNSQNKSFFWPRQHEPVQLRICDKESL